MMIRSVALVALVAMWGCTKDPSLTPAEKDALEKIALGTHELVAKTDLATMRTVGRFQLVPLGVRTWRLDTSTGDNCLLLTSEQDWKDEKVQAQACALR